MKRTLLTAVAGFSLLCVGATAAEPSNPLVGAWGLTGTTVWDLEANTLSHPYGKLPTGTAVYTAGGHAVLFLAAEGRPKPSGAVLTDAERIAHYGSVSAAYAGTYRIDGDKLTVKLTTGLNPLLDGTEQIRYFNIEGEKLIVRTAPFPNRSTGVQSMSFVTYTKLE